MDTYAAFTGEQIAGAYNTKLDLPMNHAHADYRIKVANLPNMRFIGDLSVEPEFRERGIANALMKHAIARGPSFLVAQKGSIAFRMYEKLGFKDVCPGSFSSTMRLMIRA